MIIGGTINVRCSACGHAQDVRLVQSINTKKQPEHKARLLWGELNVASCRCGARIPLEANLLFHDPDAQFYCHVCPGGPDALAAARAAFDASFDASITTAAVRRVVPNLNALVEKVKILDAGLTDWAVELTKVMLLASLPEPDLERLLLFDGVLDPGDGRGDASPEPRLRWLMLAREPVALTSPRAAYDKLAAQAACAPAAGDYSIDRAWALAAARRLVHASN